MADNNAPKAKKLSPETEAIIDRLKREGQLTRNSEGNSIKSIKINLEKFADAFTAIQKSTEDTARIMTENFVDGNTEILKKVDDTLEGMTDEQKKAEMARRKEAKLKAVADKERSREETFGLKALGSNLKGLGKGIKDGFLGIKKDPWGTLLNIGKWALVIPLLAGAIKGVLDLIFGEEKVAEVYRKVNEVGTKFINFLKDPNWGIILGGLATFSLLNWAKLYAEMMLMARALGVKGGMGGGTDVLTTGGDGDGKKGSRKDRFKKILGKAKGKGGVIVGALSLVTIGGVQYLMDEEDEPIDLTQDIQRINAKNDQEDAAVTQQLVDKFENERKGFGTILSETLLGTAVGGAFGGVAGGGVGAIPGAITGALFGAISGIGQVGYDVYRDMKYDIDKLPNELEKALKLEQSKNKLHLMYGRDDAAAELTANTTSTVKSIIDGLVEENTQIDADIKAREAALTGEVTRQRRGSSRVYDDYVMIDGQPVKKSIVEKELEEAKERRLIREQQLITSRKVLALRTQEIADVQENVDAVKENTEEVKKATVKKKEEKPIDIEPAQTEERERKQNVAAGGFALNIVNNYYNKGGDTVVQNQADNRVNSTKNTAIAASGVGGSSRFSGGVGLPTGQMA